MLGLEVEARTEIVKLGQSDGFAKHPFLEKSKKSKKAENWYIGVVFAIFFSFFFFFFLSFLPAILFQTRKRKTYQTQIFALSKPAFSLINAFLLKLCLRDLIEGSI